MPALPTMTKMTTSFRFVRIAPAVLLASTAMLMTGCQSTKNLFANYDNGSLDYQDSKLLDPIRLPAQQETQPFVPFYPTINLGDSVIDVKNTSGKQYQLPTPSQYPTNP